MVRGPEDKRARGPEARQEVGARLRRVRSRTDSGGQCDWLRPDDIPSAVSNGGDGNRGEAARGYAGTLACCEAEASSKGGPETGIDASGIISPANYPVSGFPLRSCLR